MTTTPGRRALAFSIRAAIVAVGPLALCIFSACAAAPPTEVPGDDAGTNAVGGGTAQGGAGGVLGAAGGATAGTNGALGGAGGALGGAGGATGGSAGVGGAIAGSTGVGGALGGSAGAGGAVAGSTGVGGALGGFAGAGGATSGAGGMGTGGTTAGSAGMGMGGSAGRTPATDRMTAWNDENYGCGNCHGEQGEGIANRGPEIRHPDRMLFDFMTRNGDAMPLAAYRDPMEAVPASLISDAIMNDIFTWLGSFPKPTTGAELFADYCSYCHGADGRGGGTTVAYAKASHSAPFMKMGAEFLAAVRSGHVKSGSGGTINVSNRTEWMHPVPATVLTDQEVALIEAWLPKN